MTLQQLRTPVKKLENKILDNLQKYCYNIEIVNILEINFEYAFGRPVA